MPTRYVILHHTIGDCEHWDLMLEYQGVLLTWRLDREPRGPADLPIPATRIANHRMAYLDYEGPLPSRPVENPSRPVHGAGDSSNDRGSVRRVDAGALELHELAPQHCRFTLTGGRLFGQFALTQESAYAWRLECIE